MTKQEILDKFNDINFVYNDSSKHDTLSMMLDELLKEQEAKKFFVDISGKITPLPVVVRCKDCVECYFASNRVPDEQSYACEKHGIDVTPDWFCADGERKPD